MLQIIYAPAKYQEATKDGAAYVSAGSLKDSLPEFATPFLSSFPAITGVTHCPLMKQGAKT